MAGALCLAEVLSVLNELCDEAQLTSLERFGGSIGRSEGCEVWLTIGMVRNTSVACREKGCSSFRRKVSPRLRQFQLGNEVGYLGAFVRCRS